MSGREGSESAELLGELWSIASALGEVVLDDDEVDGEVAVEAAKEEGCELAKFIIIGELEETELKLRSVLRGFPPLLLLLLLVLLVKGHVVGGEVIEGPSADPIHLRITLNFEFILYKFGVLGIKAVCLGSRNNTYQASALGGMLSFAFSVGGDGGGLSTAWRSKFSSKC